MHKPIIKAILDSLNSSYERGECDNLSKKEELTLLELFKGIYNILTDKQDKVLTIEETTKYLGITRPTLSSLVKQGKLKPKKHLGGVQEFKLIDLKNYIKENKK